MTKRKAPWELSRRRPERAPEVQEFGAEPSHRAHYQATLAQPNRAALPFERPLMSYRQLAKMISDFEPDD